LVSAIVFDSSADLLFVDPQEEMVREVAAGSLTMTRVVGLGMYGYVGPGNGDGGPATSATLGNPQGLAIDSAGNLYISDTSHDSVREVTSVIDPAHSIINTVAGNGGGCNSLGGDGGPALDASLCYPEGLTIDQAGNLFFAQDGYNRIREITAPAAPPSAATPAPVFSLAAGTYPSAKTLTMTAVPGAEIYLTLDGSTPTVSSRGYYNPIAIAGSVTVSAIALAPGLLPSGVEKASYKVTAPVTATITTVAGSGIYANPGMGGPALKAEFGYPCGIAADSAGNLYIADPNDGVVWKLTAATQTVSVVAGTPGTTGAYSGEGGPATKAILGSPGFVASDPSGNLFISDGGTSRVYKVTAKTGIITTYAGGGQSYDYPVFGDGGSATAAILNNPEGIALDKSGNLYIADLGVGRIRLVHAATGIITSVAGNSSATTLGDGGLATAAMLSGPVNVALDGSGNLLIVETGDARIREVNAETKIITTVAGMGIYGYSGDGGPATEAAIGPYGIAIDAAGAIYFSNADSAIREFVPGGAISTIAGTGYWGFAGDGGPARMAEFCNPAGLAFDKAGSLYIADACNYRVRKVSFTKGAQD